MSTRSRPLTVDDVRASPDLGERYEFIDGELFVPPAPFTLHQRVQTRLSHWISHVLAPMGQLDYLFHAPCDVRLSKRRLLQPDLFYVSPDRAEIMTEELIDGAPDLVVEILSAATRARDLVLKRRLDAEAGVREYWIVDPAARTISLLGLAAGQWVELPRGPDGFRSRVLSGLVIDPEVSFAGL